MVARPQERDWKDIYMLHGDNQARHAFETDALDRATLARRRAYMVAALNRHIQPARLHHEFR
jgi:hypothetical protein